MIHLSKSVSGVEVVQSVIANAIQVRWLCSSHGEETAIPKTALEGRNYSAALIKDGRQWLRVADGLTGKSDYLLPLALHYFCATNRVLQITAAANVTTETLRLRRRINIAASLRDSDATVVPSLRPLCSIVIGLATGIAPTPSATSTLKKRRLTYIHSVMGSKNAAVSGFWLSCSVYWRRLQRFTKLYIFQGGETRSCAGNWIRNFWRHRHAR